VAALAVGLIDAISKAYWPQASYFVLFAPLAAFLVFRPQGLFGRAAPVLAPAAPVRGGRATTALHHLPSLARRRGQFGLFGVLAVVLLALFFWPWIGSDYALGITTLALIWAIFAVGLNLALGYAGTPSLGHAAFFGIGAYAVAFSGKMLDINGWVALAVAIIAAAFISALIGVVVLRTKHIQFLLATVAASQLVWGVAFKWRALTGGDDGMSNGQMIAFPGSEALSPAAAMYWIVLALFIITGLLAVCLHRSRFRLVLNGIKENERRLSALGYHTWVYRFGVFVISGTLSGIAGALFAFYAGFVSPDLLSIAVSGQVLLIVIMGGAGTLYGPIIGACLLILFKEYASAWTGQWQAAEGVLFIVIALLRQRPLLARLPRLWSVSQQPQELRS
jgi:branched-chain amino acid transport system permease protein